MRKTRKVAPPKKETPAPVWSVPGRVPPDIARGDYELARDLLDRFTDSHRRLSSLPKPWTEAERKKIDVLVTAGPNLLRCIEALLEGVAMFFQENVDQKRWRRTLERRNAALTMICTYANYPEVLDDFTANRHFLGLSSGLSVALKSGLRNETPKDWDRTIAVGEALLRCEWSSAESAYGLLRTVSSRVLFDQVRARYGGSVDSKGLSLSGQVMRRDVDEMAAKLQAGWKYEDRIISGLARHTHERSAQQILDSVRVKRPDDVELAQYIDAACRLSSPALIRIALGWTASRIKRVRGRLRALAKAELIDAKR